jgi:hypothetical protein
VTLSGVPRHWRSRTDARKAVEVDDGIRQAAQDTYQALIELERRRPCRSGVVLLRSRRT